MATSPIDYPTLIAQLPYVSKLATGDQTASETRQELFSPLIIQKQREKDKEQVPEVHKKQKTSAVDREGGGGAQGGGHAGRRRGDETQDAGEEPEGPPISSPWAGNIIDKKI